MFRDTGVMGSGRRVISSSFGTIEKTFCSTQCVKDVGLKLNKSAL